MLNKKPVLDSLLNDDELDENKIIYYFNIKKKVESLLDKIVQEYSLQPYLSIYRKYMFDDTKMQNCSFWEKYKRGVKNNNERIISGRDVVPNSFEEWLEAYLSDYHNAVTIYYKLCKTHIVEKADLVLLNSINKRFQ